MDLLPPPTAAAAAPPRRTRDYHSTDFAHASLQEEGAAYLARALALMTPSAAVRSASAYDPGCWSSFYARHAGSFFKPRYFLLEAFPHLESGAQRNVLEVGVGNGSNLFALLEANLAVRVMATDVAQTSLDTLRNHGGLTAEAATRLSLLLWNVCDPPPASLPRFDTAMAFFVLSALHPDDHGRALLHIRSTLAPGGVLAFRDYGQHDLAQLRASDDAILSPQLHRRGDGTLAYYFELEALRTLLEKEGFVVEELAYCCVENVNRKKGITMKRVFVHARCRNPIPDQGQLIE